MKHDALLTLARDRMSAAQNADRENRAEDMDDLRQIVGVGQWPEDIRATRESEGKPCLTINRFPQFVRQVTGDLRRMNPAINVMPADGASSQETAEIIEGLIRHIEYRSDASSVYEQTAESAAGCSIGWFRITHDYENDTSFDQEILLKRIRNPFSVYVDPQAELPTRADAGWLFITEQMDRDEFKKAYPGKRADDAKHDSATDGMEHWHVADKVVVAEYYWKQPVERTLGLLEDGTVVEDPVAPLMVVRTRKVKSHKLMWAKISGQDVLEGPTEQASKHIPVIAITGEEWHVGDRVYRSSVIRHAKDSQQMYNYFRSASAEIVALQPKAPFMVTAKQIAGLETFWNEANAKNRPYLPYNADEKAPPPQRMQPPVSAQGIFNELQIASDDMKATTGIYDAGLGNRSNEQSGVAIRQRQMESDISTSIYADNMAKAIAQAGRIILEMIPSIYDTQRTLRIIGKDGAEKMIPVNGVMVNQGQAMPVNDLTIGQYDIRVDVGPNYSTRRQETAEGMLEFVRTFPRAAEVTGDLIAKSMDWPDADQFAERLKKLLPAGVISPEDMSPEEQQEWQAGMQQQQMQAQMAQAAQEAQIRKEMAEADEAGSDAQKAQFEVMNEQLELAAKSGQLNAAISQIVQVEVARALQGAMAAQAPMGAPPGY